MLTAVVLSHLSSFYIFGARMAGMEFLKIVIYYLLLVGLIDRVERLRQFLGWLSRTFRPSDGADSPPAYTIREPRDGRRVITPPPQIPRLGRTRFE
jgi:hypothetical protein